MIKKYFAGLVGILCFISPSWAHHSGGHFDDSQEITLTGTVMDFQWKNPHCYVQLQVVSDNGEEAEWSLEMAAPVYLYNLGWRPSTLKPGEQITVLFRPLRNGREGGLIRQVLDADGNQIGA